jgi:glycosyltransferase involved in cell wall biosynthesis
MSRRLLYLVNDPAFFLSHRLPLAQKALRCGYDVHVATPEGKGVERIKREGFEFHEIPLLRKSTNAWNEINTVRALFKLYSELRPDIVHHVTIKPVLYGGLAARLAQVPAVVSAVTGLGYVFLAEGLRASLLRAGVKRAYRLALNHRNSRVIFQNPDDRLEFLRNDLVDEAKTVIIKGSGVDMERFVPQPEPEGTPLILLASRMLSDKGILEFVEAARIIRQEGIKARFVLVGDTDLGNPAGVPVETLKEWGREGIVEWWGRKKDMEKVFSQAHIVCLPSYREGVPKVLIEAAACGKPIVTTDVPGCREIVKHELNGLLVPVKDGIELARALKTLIQKADLRRQLGQNGRKLAVADFSEEQVIHETLSVYDDLLSVTVAEAFQFR